MIQIEGGMKVESASVVAEKKSVENPTDFCQFQTALCSSQ